MTLSIGRMGQRFGLSRSALLYYDRIGLLSPSQRSRSGYRLYDDDDQRRLAAICRFRAAGLTLDAIRELLDGAAGRTAELLAARREQLDAEIGRLREQQQIVVRLLANPERLERSRAMDKDRWVAILRAAGVDDAAMHRWHVEFERMAPEAHEHFLGSLGLPRAEIARIRRGSRPSPPGARAPRSRPAKPRTS